MDLTAEERKEIEDSVLEKMMLLIPEVVGNLIVNHINQVKTNKEFYSKHPEFKNHKDTVASVIEMLEGKDPLKPQEDILKEAVQKIRDRIRTVKSIDIDSVSEDVTRDINGVL